jgi:ferrochelatase
MTPSTAVVLMAYGTPRDPAEIPAYYTDIRRGRPPTPELLAQLTARYDAIGGLSPLAARTEAQRAALAAALETRAPGTFEVVLGMKHAEPKIEAAVAEVRARGLRRAVGLVLAPHYSAFSVGEYLERAERAGREAGVEVLGIEAWHLLPAYLEFLARAVAEQLATLPAPACVLFTAHSLPARILETGDPYPDQLRATASAVAAGAGLTPDQWGLAWQSAGRTPEPWLGPDILAVIDELGAASAVRSVLVCACGFVSDHLEVLYDLDLEAARHAEGVGLAFARTAAVNDDPAVMGALADLVVARAA